MTASFLTYLESQLAKKASLPKRERTRERLRIATLEVLNERGYEDMKTLTITEKAGLSEGLFYVYFKSKVDITLDLLDQFYEGFARLHLQTHAVSDPLEVIKRTNREWLRLAVGNPGVMRCIFQAGNEVPEFAALISKVNKDWYTRASNAVERRRPTGSKQTRLLPMYMLGGMMDELARKLVVYPDPELIALIAENGSDYDAVADAATMIWCRVLYPNDAVPEGMSDFAQQLVGHI